MYARILFRNHCIFPDFGVLRLWGTLLLQVSIRPPHFLKLPSAAVRKRDGDVLAGSSLLMMLMRCRCNRRLLCNYIP